jgi:hypothetical protein
MPYIATIVLCLDIDETVMNSKTEPYSLIDFNGVDTYADASAWTNFLKKMIRYCEERFILLIIEFISAKTEAIPDDTVEFIVKYFHEFLHVLNKNGEPIPKSYYPTHFILRRYLDENSQEDRLYIVRRTKGDVKVDVKNELPPIHLCSNNQPGTKQLSKAWVMKAISEHFAEPIPAKNMFMLDNDLGNLEDISSGAKGTTPCYQAVSSHELEKLMYSSKSLRTLSCTVILKELEIRIMTRVAEISFEMQVTQYLARSFTHLSTFASLTMLFRKSSSAHQVEDISHSIVEEDYNRDQAPLLKSKVPITSSSDDPVEEDDDFFGFSFPSFTSDTKVSHITEADHASLKPDFISRDYAPVVRSKVPVTSSSDDPIDADDFFSFEM